MLRRRLPCVAAILLSVGTLQTARAEDSITVTGHIYAADSKQPLGNATIAVYDDKNQVIDHAKTGSDGKYTLTVPRYALHFPVHHGGNFLGGLVKGLGKAVRTGLSVAAPLAMSANPIAGAGIGMTQSMIGGGLGGRAMSGLRGVPMPGVGALSIMRHGMMPGATMDPAMARQLVKQMQANGMAVPPQLLAMANGEEEDTEPIAPNASGALPIRVSLSDYADTTGVTQLYYLQGETDHAEGKDRNGIQGWVDPVYLAGTKDSAQGKTPSYISHTYFKLRQAQAEPSIAEYGQKVKISVKMTKPSDLEAPVIVIAHNVKTGKDYELTSDGNDLYSAEIMVDKEFAKNEQALGILAYAPSKDGPGRSKKREDAMRGEGMWNLDKLYVFNPLVAVSRNRVEVKLTVVDPARK